ncbi:MAG TPA: hypothetical protein VJI46_01155 [Candidatus Nanoarchaeia archaeon]|nr:hypothetical protein [Candidatus Nanoarchaeia archaeon]
MDYFNTSNLGAFARQELESVNRSGYIISREGVQPINLKTGDSQRIGIENKLVTLTAMDSGLFLKIDGGANLVIMPSNQVKLAEPSGELLEEGSKSYIPVYSIKDLILPKENGRYATLVFNEDGVVDIANLTSEPREKISIRYGKTGDIKGEGIKQFLHGALSYLREMFYSRCQSPNELVVQSNYGKEHIPLSGNDRYFIGQRDKRIDMPKATSKYIGLDGKLMKKQVVLLRIKEGKASLEFTTPEEDRGEASLKPEGRNIEYSLDSRVELDPTISGRWELRLDRDKKGDMANVVRFRFKGRYLPPMPPITG